MLVACRLAGLSALGAHYAGVKLQAMRAEHGTTHQDHAGTSRAALDIEHRTSQRMGMRADGRPPVRLDIDIDTGNADGEDGPQGCPGARGRQGPSVHVRNRGGRRYGPYRGYLASREGRYPMNWDCSGYHQGFSPFHIS